MFTTTYTYQETQWLHDNYYSMDWEELEWNFKVIFGRRVCGKSLRRKCYNDGLRKQVFGINESHKNLERGICNPNNKGRKLTKSQIFNQLTGKYGIVDTLLRGHTP